MLPYKTHFCVFPNLCFFRLLSDQQILARVVDNNTNELVAMDKEQSLLNDVNLVFVNPDERTCSLYHKHFREIDGTSVIKGTSFFWPNECVLV